MTKKVTDSRKEEPRGMTIEEFIRDLERRMKCAYCHTKYPTTAVKRCEKCGAPNTKGR